MIKDRDNGYRQTIARAHELAKVPWLVKVGLLAQSNALHGTDGVVDLVEVATIHEFGLGAAPERSWLRAWVDESQPEIVRRLNAVTQDALAGKVDVKTGLERFGLWAAGQVKLRIRNGIGPALEPETVARKGSSTPLIDTGQLWSAISAAVEHAA